MQMFMIVVQKQMVVSPFSLLNIRCSENNLDSFAVIIVFANCVIIYKSTITDLPKHRAGDDFSKKGPYWLMDENYSEFSTNDHISIFFKKR